MTLRCNSKMEVGRAAEELNALKPDFWTNADVGSWLKLSGFENLIGKFKEHDISGFNTIHL